MRDDDGATKTRVLIADDHEVVREGIRMLVAHQPDMDVCGVAASGREAIEMALELKPTVAVIDLQMPDTNGVEVVRDLRRDLPATALVVFTGQQSERMIAQLFELGVKSFVRKADASEMLVAAIRSAARQKPFFTPEVSEVLFARFFDEGTENPTQELTKRERQIICMVAEGRANKEIADALKISTRTAESHRAALMRKLRISSTAELVRYAIRNGFLEA